MSEVLNVGIVELDVSGTPTRYLVFDNEAFDWEISLTELAKVITFCGDSAEAKKALNGDIQKHFLGCLAEFLGFPVTLEEIMQAVQTGKLKRKG